MPRRVFRRWALLASIAAPGLLGGCHLPSARPKEHASASLLDSGPSARVTGRQAADVRIAVGRSHEEGGKLAEAEASYIEALKKDPRRADAEARLAILADRKGDAAAADRHFARALKLAPRDPEILCDRGYSLYLRRRWAEAESSLDGALAASPGHARAHSNLALVLARRGENERALAEFARAGLDPSDARSNLALVLATEGRLEEARREYGLALAAKPGSAAAKEGLRASTVALAGPKEGRALAAKGGAGPGTVADPAVRRTSAVPGQ